MCYAKSMGHTPGGDCLNGAAVNAAADAVRAGVISRLHGVSRLAEAPHPEGALLIASGLNKAYNFRPVLRHVDLALPPGTLTLIHGPNGAGKSTLLRILAGLTMPDAGLIHRAAPPEAIGFMTHEPCAYVGLSALENLTFWSKLHGLALGRDALNELLREAGLADAAHELTTSFSQGMLQRLNLVRCFVAQPRLVFLDEPANGLDRTGLALLKQRLAATCAAGGAVVLVGHQLQSFLSEADFVLSLAPVKPDPEADSSNAVYYGPARTFDARIIEDSHA